MDRLSELELFVETAESGSLTRAAEQLGLSNSAASRQLRSLETRLGARLVQRTTRRLHLTETGSVFLQRAKLVLESLREAEAEAGEASANPTGLLRVTASLSFCVQHIAPLLRDFMQRCPKLAIEVIAANRYQDLIESGIDVAIRTREFENDSSITVRRLAQTRRIMAASPAYLAERGVPRAPQELTDHAWLIYAYANDPHKLQLTRGEEQATVRIRPLLTANDGQVIRAAAHDGLGILVQPRYIVHDDIVAGRLVPVLPDWNLPRLTINIAFQTREHLPAKVRLFVDFLIAHFRRHDFERRWTA